jgi:pimeloyl-ACP methyl ester carboxylesterase
MFDAITSVPVADGETVEAIVDEARTPIVHGDVVLGPVFGATAHSMFPFAYALACNGFRVSRVDFRYHVGMSSGTIEHTHMSRMAEDLTAVCRATPGSILVGVSLSARAAMRTLASTSATRAAVLMIPVVDVRSTLTEVIGTDHLGSAVEDIPEHVMVLDYLVHRDFVVDLRRQRMVGLGDAVTDLISATVPVSFIAGDADPWVAPSDVRHVVDACRDAGVDNAFIVIPAATHRLNRNPAVAVRYIDAVTRECLRLAGADPDAVVMPTFDETVRAMSEARNARRDLVLRSVGGVRQ